MWEYIQTRLGIGIMMLGGENTLYITNFIQMMFYNYCGAINSNFKTKDAGFTMGIYTDKVGHRQPDVRRDFFYHIFDFYNIIYYLFLCVAELSSLSKI